MSEIKVPDYIKCTFSKLINIDDIKFHPKNPNKHSEEQLKRLSQILEYQGFRRTPVVSKRSGYLIVGEGRIRAAKILGWNIIPVDLQDYESEDQEYADMVADNAIDDWSFLDYRDISKELENILLPDIDLLGIKNFTFNASDKLHDLDEEEFSNIEKEKINQKPIISYYGGKQRLAPKLIPLIPKHTVYVEPFCGGAALLFAKPYPNIGNRYIEYINDLDKDLINMYRIFQTRFDDIEHLLLNTLFSQEEHRKASQILKRELEADELWLAWAYYVNIYQSFSKIVDGGWGVSITNDKAKSWCSKITSLNEYRARMSRVNISCDDAFNVIQRLDAPQTLFYCDPPYVGADQHYHYKEKFTIEQYQELIELLDSIQGSFILSHYEVPNIRIPKNWEIYRFRAHCSASGKGKTNIKDKTRKQTEVELGNRERVEVVYRRKSRFPVRDDIKKLYDSGALDCFKG